MEGLTKTPILMISSTDHYKYTPKTIGFLPSHSLVTQTKLSYIDNSFFILIKSKASLVVKMSSMKSYAPDHAKTRRWKLDGKAIDQGIAYGLMIVALFVIYLVHWENLEGSMLYTFLLHNLCFLLSIKARIYIYIYLCCIDYSFKRFNNLCVSF